MESVALIGIDLRKHSFHLHGQDRQGKMVFRKKDVAQALVESFGWHESGTIRERNFAPRSGKGTMGIGLHSSSWTLMISGSIAIGAPA